MIIAIIIAIIIAVALTLSYLKRPQIGNLHLWAGGVKTGKSASAVRSAIKLHKKAVRKWSKAFKDGKASLNKPCLYSNVPLMNYPYKPLKLEHITMKERMEDGSITYLQEVSLLAGSLDIKDPKINDVLLHFFKLYAHLTKGGYCILDTQSPMDMHFSIKRSLSSYWHILKTVNIPHIGLLSIVEQRQVVDSEVKSPIDNAEQHDTARNLVEKLLPRQVFVRFVPATTYKYYDRYCNHALVADKPIDTQTEVVTTDGQLKKEVRIRDANK